MTTLHMEVETVANVQNDMKLATEELNGMLTKLSTSIQQLRDGQWMGRSAEQFFMSYEGWHKGMAAQLQDLMTLSSELQNEIREWENAANHLGQ